jgi:hypothetical protein
MTTSLGGGPMTLGDVIDMLGWKSSSTTTSCRFHR